MLQGGQSWTFPSKPVILASTAIGGPFEAQGALANDFDLLHDDFWLKQDSFEKAERKLLEEACHKVMDKAGILIKDIQFFLSGDLTNQIISSNFAARTLGLPYLGLYGACSSAMEGLALAALFVENGEAVNVIIGTSSHNAVAEKQFRYPTEYGAQKPPTAQWTVTGAGAALIGKAGNGPKVTAATIGKVIDMGIKDPYNMGAAMAPAAVDTIKTHFKDLNRDPSYYDLIVTGDLGVVGHSIAGELLQKEKIIIPPDKFSDCGILIYRKEQEVFSGGSGCACCAVVTYGHLVNRMHKGELNKILVVATGALLSPLSYQQQESIPGIAHAVAIEI